jgi:hypothetical protein
MTDKHALVSSIPERCRKEKWLIYHDLGMGKLMWNHLIKDKKVSDILPQCKKKARFGGSDFPRSVWTLEEETLYEP